MLIAQRVEDGARPGDVAVLQEVVYEKRQRIGFVAHRLKASRGAQRQRVHGGIIGGKAQRGQPGAIHILKFRATSGARIHGDDVRPDAGGIALYGHH